MYFLDCFLIKIIIGLRTFYLRYNLEYEESNSICSLSSDALQLWR